MKSINFMSRFARLHSGIPILAAAVLVTLLWLAPFSLSAQSSPEEVARALITAESANQPDVAFALFAPDALVTLPTGVLDTPDAIHDWQQELADGHFHVEAVHLMVDGNFVTWDGTVSLDRFRDMGIAALPGTWNLDIADGMIRAFTFSFTPDAFTTLTTGAIAAALIGAESTHDVDTAVSLFADDAVVTLPTGVLDTTDAIRAWQQELADGHFYLDPVGVRVDGTNISWTGIIALDRFRDTGIATLDGEWHLMMEDGKIKSFDFNFTPAAMDMLMATPSP